MDEGHKRELARFLVQRLVEEVRDHGTAVPADACKCDGWMDGRGRACSGCAEDPVTLLG